MTETLTPDGGRLRQSQAARRQRAIVTVLELARTGGYDAIQVRAIAERTGISSDTIYRYFGSRDGLISQAVTQWIHQELVGPAPTWLVGETPAEQLLAYCRNVWAVWEQSPALLEVFVRAALAEGPAEDGLAARTVRTLVPITEHALRDVEPGYRDDLLMVVEHFTHSAMTFVVRGQLAVDEVFPQLERVVRRLAQHPAMAGHRPASWDWEPESPGK